MNSLISTPGSLPFRASSPSGLSFEFNANGSIRRIDHGDIMLNLFLGNELEGGLANLYLRKHGNTQEAIALLGPHSPAHYEFSERGMLAYGTWADIHFRLRLILAETSPTWFWHVEIENIGDSLVTCDLIHSQDIGLAHYGAIRLNEFYVSQYIDHAPLIHEKHGQIIASRQNQAMGGRWPWTAVGSLGKAISYATDALQFYGLTARTGNPSPALALGLPRTRLQHEHSMVAIQDKAFLLAPKAKCQRGFFGVFQVTHPSATSEEDLSKIDTSLMVAEAVCPAWPVELVSACPVPSLFASASLLDSLELDTEEVRSHFGDERTHTEISNGKLLSFFTSNGSHVVMVEKERNVLRPHGHLLRSGGSLTPDESALTSTAWMSGVFQSMVTQGHVSINRMLSTCHTYLGLFRSHGQRIFVENEGQWLLLGNPSAYEMHYGSCCWIYKHMAGTIRVTASTPDNLNELRLSISILSGKPARFLISHHIALNGDDGSNRGQAIFMREGDAVFVTAAPGSDVGRRFPDRGFMITPSPESSVEAIGGDELLFPDGISREQAFICFISAPCLAWGLKIEGQLVDDVTTHLPEFWNSIGAGLRIDAPAAAPLGPAAAALGKIFPWFIHNAFVHYLSPRGLEQYSGGGWGTRDVCQGPVELLLALGRFGSIRDLLCRVFTQQNMDGDWPQWFMFFERERSIRPQDSHGDIVYWPVLALAQYLIATGDQSLLEEPLPFFHPDGDEAGGNAKVWDHLERAVTLIESRVIKGTHLAAYGHGDWNDSLQPAKPEMREQLCSSWTVTLNHQTFTTLARAFKVIGDDPRTTLFEKKAAPILDEFQRLLIVDGTIAGLAFFDDKKPPTYLLHPHDRTTGLSYSLLPMVHAIINGMFTREQAAVHLALIRQHLLGPDGARLFDRPMVYQGGLQMNFQRAESASYFGREIGIMYTHAHLRYCEALAHFGDAEGFFHALCQINPIGIREIVSSASLRQANCYYSSSDAAFADRYDAYDNYEKINNGEIPLEGGWRIYSSGAGISTRLIMQCFLGLRLEKTALVIDPMIPAGLDGLKISIRLLDKPFEITYQIRANGYAPATAILNGAQLDFTREDNPYRQGGIRIPLEALLSNITDDENQLLVMKG